MDVLAQLEARSDISDALNGSAGKGQGSQGISLNSFLASVAVSAIVFGAEFLVFVLLKNKLVRIYSPRTYLVPERERTKAPHSGILGLGWILPIFTTSSSEFIQKCGLDAYFFLRYLRTLLKIFIPLAIVILPILLPLNHISGRGSHFGTGDNSGQNNVTGLDTLSWSNISPNHTRRYWAHLVLAILVVVYVCFVFYDELRRYIRLRQAYLTSPQHRLRASATTVLVSAIPKKWCSVEALDGLYDVFPGGIRNIWINRNFDELLEKVQLRNKLAQALEAAETDLIKKAKKAQLKQLEKDAKKANKDLSKQERARRKQARQEAQENAAALAMMDGAGMSSGNPHQVRHTLQEALNDASGANSRSSSRSSSPTKGQRRHGIPVPVVGQGLDMMSHGFEHFGHSLAGGFKRFGKDVDGRLTNSNGFVYDDDPRYGLPAVHRAATAPVDGMDEGRRDMAVERTESLDTTARPSTSTLQGHVDTTDTAHTAEEARHQSDASDKPERPRSIDERDYAQQETHSSVRNAERTPDPEKGSEGSSGPPKSSWLWWWRGKSKTSDVPSPQPKGREDDEYPLTTLSPTAPSTATQATVHGEEHGPDAEREKIREKSSKNPFKKHAKEGDRREDEEYPAAYNEDFDNDEYGEPLWRKYVKESDRDTMRLPIFGWGWMPALPLIGKKVDTIYHCRKELARLNLEIERDQQEPEKFPLMNSAFVQFNHQVAAHMACQAVSHHVPKQMAPRLVEISPDDVLWENMSVKWWERYLRTAAVMALVVFLIIGWAFPVTFTGLLSNISYLTTTFPWLGWIRKLPKWVLSLVQGVLPQALLAALLALLPITLRFLARQQGVHTGMAIELSVQNYYFAFLFVQVFLVVSISSGITTIIKQLSDNLGSAPQLLAANLPKASNYFFSYMLLQAFSVSAGALVQIGGLVSWFILAPLLDNTARQKWARQTNLPQMMWGTFFPVYTTLAAIGLIYSVISPLILLFDIITFSLFWVVYRYNTLYVTKFRFDTGGLLYPRAINQLFTGLYIMELCLVGLFFLVRDEHDRASCKSQAIVMIVVGILTVAFQFLLNEAFGPLFRYLPITLEDDAVRRDEEFARAQSKRFGLVDDEEPGETLEDTLKRNERDSREEQEEDFEKPRVDGAEEEQASGKPDRRHRRIASQASKKLGKMLPDKSWADRSRNRRASYMVNPKDPKAAKSTAHDHVKKSATDIEAQRINPIAEALFSGINDEIEDLTPDERDKLVQRAFQHEALRAKRPVIWIPRDDLGVSDDEIYRTQNFSKHIWISNEYTGLDRKGRVVYRRSPPDFSEVDLIEL
ncbi:DUF221-domain-containing protein [Xylona heveae TC161]|uniref:DUF221-domain-containing protein n=1 Tax=Xylona heveae (strain CBS 132557 / TC161) TaxID=1328760 RepID=A0A165GP32_XYLHT|nr:DUF221-domain-containing protein [Xylona heveae TC161]KZF22423.1 DUF221-domain-containing protein [Xylona heveae TC161]